MGTALNAIPQRQLGRELNGKLYRELGQPHGRRFSVGRTFQLHHAFSR